MFSVLKKKWSLVFLTLILMFVGAACMPPQAAGAVNPSAPSATVPLIFIHHSTGENWLSDDIGGLGRELMDNNYFVSDTNYGWGPDAIGDTTDIGHWWLWFRGPSSSTYTDAVFWEKGQNSGYSRMDNDPGGENEIIMFKSCFPNSNLQGSPGAPVPSIENNPLAGQDSGSEYMTVANAKGIYIDLLDYFATRPDKMFVVVTAPPLLDPSNADNARAFNQWLVNDWLAGYDGDNVFVYDFYNVLTSNGGSPDVNDLGSSSGNHHRYWNGGIQHVVGYNSNILAYPSGDEHPNYAGNQKATAEFVPWLNCMYNAWRSGQPSIPIETDNNPPPDNNDNSYNGDNGIVVLINGEELYCDVPPVIENGRTLVPFRAIFEALGAEVSWDPSDMSVYATKDDISIRLRLDDPVAYINDEPVTLDVPPRLESDRTLVPLRFVAEALGAEVGWHPENNTVTVDTGGGGGGEPGQGAAACKTLLFYLDSSTYYADGFEQTMESPPVVIDGRSYIPVRYASEPLGAAVNWFEQESRIKLDVNGRTVELWLNRNTARVNGAEVMIDEENPDAAPFLSPEGRTMVPVRFVAENLGFSVKYKNLDGSITISSGP